MSDFYIFRKTLQDLFRIKNLIAMVLVGILPVGIALLSRLLSMTGTYVAGEVYDEVSQSIVYSFVLTMLACVFGTGLISQEVEQKTIVYLLTRPMARWRILLMKYAAAAVATITATLVATLLLEFATGGLPAWAKLPVGRDLLILPVACLAYGGLFLLLATLFKRPLIIGLIYAFGIESWVPNLPGSFKMASLMAYIRALAPHPLSGLPNATNDISMRVAWIVTIGVIVVTVGAALVVFSTNEYVPRDEV